MGLVVSSETAFEMNNQGRKSVAEAREDRGYNKTISSFSSATEKPLLLYANQIFMETSVILHLNRVWLWLHVVCGYLVRQVQIGNQVFISSILWM